MTYELFTNTDRFVTEASTAIGLINLMMTLDISYLACEIAIRELESEFIDGVGIGNYIVRKRDG